MLQRNYFQSVSFIALIAAMMGLTAFTIDAMLPAFGEMTKAFSLPKNQANKIQYVVFAYMFGFATMQPIFGFLGDALGRKWTLISGIGLFVIASAAVFFINEFKWLLVARFVQGMGLAAPRVLSTAIVRDVASGREMARIMSYAVMVFMIVPMLAPSIGQLTMQAGGWHAIFRLFVFAGLLVIIWILYQLPETLIPEERARLNIKSIKAAFIQCLGHSATVIQLIIIGMIFAMTMTYIGQAEQIFGRDIYHLGDKFPLIFALNFSGLIAASFLNSRWVLLHGMQRIIRIATLAMSANAIILVFLSWIYAGIPPLWFFLPLLITHFFFQGLLMPNLNTLILVPHRNIAGTASAIIGAGMTIIGAVLGGQIASHFNATLYPLTLGLMVLSLGITFLYRLAERLGIDE
ncbi:multidrug effflux MFS transporter [Suttonella ornithocola]|uniref:Sulfonamide resistance protein n=1 Tax=Suttonella ornithocola TaxID=279832 RepID=A0A380MUR4_9GAMM|nr:multidrug effflux MFS transporter [Suttonella ornithocola]SUO95786.1 Sulfonamide resistance protein [Suttonella ornithocola]